MAKKKTNFRSDGGRSCDGCPDGSTVTGWDFVGSKYSGPVRKWDEPIQGIADDCYFIAALMAVAYKAGGTLSTTENSFSFYNTISGNNETQTLDGTEKGNDKKVAFFNDKLHPVYARCSSLVTWGYRWPLMYEKAYALWIDKQQAQRHWDAVDPNQPDIKAILASGGSGIAAMMHISRYRKSKEKEIVWDGNVPKYPTIAAKKVPKHTYMVYGKDTSYYYLVNPCAPQAPAIKINQADLNTNNYDTWGYVYP